MRLWQPQLNNTVVSRVVALESPESHVLDRSRSAFFKFDEVGVANRSRFFRFAKVGDRILYCIRRLRFMLNYFTFYLYIYPLDLQECNGGAIHRHPIEQSPRPAARDTKILLSDRNFLVSFLVCGNMTQI